MNAPKAQRGHRLRIALKTALCPRTGTQGVMICLDGFPAEASMPQVLAQVLGSITSTLQFEIHEAAVSKAA